MSKLKKSIFVVGLLLIITSFLASIILGAYFIKVLIPIYIVGCIFIFISKTKLFYKLLIIALPLILFFPINILSQKYFMYLQRKEFIIPNNYSGVIRIIFEEKCGEKLNTENKIYKIPNDGILILSAKDDGGLNHKYFYVDESGNKNEIPKIDAEQINKPKLSIIELRYELKDNIKYYDSYLYNGTSINYNYFGSNPKLDSLMTIKVENCRKK